MYQPFVPHVLHVYIFAKKFPGWVRSQSGLRSSYVRFVFKRSATSITRGRMYLRWSPTVARLHPSSAAMSIWHHLSIMYRLAISSSSRWSAASLIALSSSDRRRTESSGGNFTLALIYTLPFKALLLPKQTQLQMLKPPKLLYLQLHPTAWPVSSRRTLASQELS